MNATFNKGDVIFRQGEYAATMYDICSGSVGIYADYQTPEEKQLAVLPAGEVFGEMGLIECYPRSATAVAMEDGTQVQEISAKEFSSYFQDSPEKVLSVMKQMSARLRETNKNYLEAMRTVYETVETEKKGEEKSGWLKSSLNFFHEVYEGIKSSRG
ncbi:MAG: cyclic nucleotide-binding domain-containing protein [Firmicutes bacterium]|nr:cyclic nucleotide-binding domain-containing protein [Bacillota bacterium]